MRRSRTPRRSSTRAAPTRPAPSWCVARAPVSQVWILEPDSLCPHTPLPRPIQTTGRSVVANFNQVKEGLCLQYTSNSTFCVTDLLTNLQTALGQDLSISSLTNLDTSSLTSVPSSAVCTDCTHGLVTKLSSALESDSTVSSNNGTITDALASYCGDSFTDGEVPDSVREASANSTNNSNVTSQPLNGASIAAAGVWKAAGGALLGVAGLVALA